MQVAVDVDGVVADFATPCNFWLASQLGCERQPIDKWNWYENYYPLKGQKLVQLVWDDFWRMTREEGEGWFDTLPIIDGAQDGVRRLTRAGHRCFFLTARNEKHYRPQTFEWLSRHGLVPLLDGLGEYLIMDRNKHDYEFDLLVDDRPDNVAAAEAAGRRAVLFDQPWNRHALGYRRAHGWKGVEAYVHDLGMRLVNA